MYKTSIACINEGAFDHKMRFLHILIYQKREEKDRKKADYTFNEKGKRI